MKEKKWVVQLGVVCAAMAMLCWTTGCATSGKHTDGGLLGTRGTIPPAYASAQDVPSAGPSSTAAPVIAGDDDVFQAPEDNVMVVPTVEIDNTPTAAPDTAAAKKPAKTAPKASGIAAAPIAPGTVYVVQKGDILSRIAVRAGVKVADILAVNPNITNPAKIRVGQKINMPAGAKAVTANSAAKGNAAATKSTATTGAATKKATKAKKVTAMPIPADGVYTVVANDSLWVIGRRFGVKIADIRAWNNLQSDKLKIGQKLMLKANASAPAAATPAATPAAPAATPAAPAATGQQPATPAAEATTPANNAADAAATTAPVEPPAVPPVAPVVDSGLKSMPFLVADGDTLEGIARSLEVTVDSILKNNPHVKSNADLKGGVTLNIVYKEQ